MKNIVNLGDAAIYCDFGSEVNKEINSKVIKYFKVLKNKNLKGVTNLSPSYNKLIITFNLSETSYDKLKQEILDLNLDVKAQSESKKISIPISIIFKVERPKKPERTPSIPEQVIKETEPDLAVLDELKTFLKYME